MPNQAIRPIVMPVFAVLLALVLAQLAGCPSNISHVPRTSETTPYVVVYSASPDRVWSATQAALSAGGRFKAIDKASGVMVTEFKVVDSNELSFISKAMLGKTYRSNYTVSLRQVAPERTEVNVKVLIEVSQLGIRSPEEQPQLNAFMRQKLFDQINAILRP
jgi:hypothetical protein